MNRSINYLMIGAFAFCCSALAKEDPAPQLVAELSFTIEAKIGESISMGESVDGQRLSIPITGGRFYGAQLHGEVLPGGADYQLIRSDGTIELHAVYMLKTHDGALINVVNDGLLVPATENRSGYFRTAPKFTAPLGRYAWLNQHLFVAAARLDRQLPDSVLIDVYQLQ